MARARRRLKFRRAARDRFSSDVARRSSSPESPCDAARGRATVRQALGASSAVVASTASSMLFYGARRQVG
eukprot:CAMPEP_0119271468 /NCGR_PEP_ID=MMETSP1329-20130426/8052_1 /TAXON_ID=114041 /ORGANISM="Genus nov. species nov., Strain RCC1024" /LENGTH=70 /DNA_ID=CAMNT_0007271517 /DNA_START=15 /DNA_END=227 /DNA_ORIENTATION=-